MRAAPPVEAVLSAGRVERMLITLLHGCAGALLAAWLALHAELRLLSPWLLAVLAAAVLMAGLGHWLALRALPHQPGRLRWDGQVWRCIAGPADQALQRLVVALDLGIWVLLRLHPADRGAPVWRVASVGSAAAAWHGLRVALAAHAGAPPVAHGEVGP